MPYILKKDISSGMFIHKGGNMKRYVKSVTKDDVFKQATQGRYLSELFTELSKLIDIMNGLSREKFEELGLESLYEASIDIYSQNRS